MATGAPLDLLEELNRLESLRDPDRQGQRKFPRFCIRGDAELYPMDGSHVDRSPIDAKLRDIGQGGVGFICEPELSVGSSWFCCFVQQGQIVARQAMLVRHCRQVQPGLHLVGGQFCLDLGTLAVLGIDPHSVINQEQAAGTDDAANFVSPRALEAEDNGHNGA